jgi:porphobilinogen synthase
MAMNQSWQTGPRMRRLRMTAALRSLVQEVTVEPRQLIQPLFIVAGETGLREGTRGLPGLVRVSLDRLGEEAAELRAAGVAGVLLFGVIPQHHKTPDGSSAADHEGPVPQGLRLLAREWPEAVLIADTCLCEYTSHGHCGLLSADPRRGGHDNDATVEQLVRAAITQARAGAHLVAPSDMMDLRIAAIRQGLDQVGLDHVGILSYAAKFASAFYGPFRDAAGSAPAHGDRLAHQLPPANRREAIREALNDAREGADMLLVKPAGAYGDILFELRQRTDLPLAAYQVSGEYAMLWEAARAGHLDLRRAVIEQLTGLRRAGADVLITYFAKQVGQWHREDAAAAP